MIVIGFPSFPLPTDDWLAGPLRYVGALLAFGCMFLWIASATHQWDALGARGQRISIAVGFVLAGISYGFYEAAETGVPFGMRVAIMCLALLSLLGALVWRWRDHP